MRRTLAMVIKNKPQNSSPPNSTLVIIMETLFPILDMVVIGLIDTLIMTICNDMVMVGMEAMEEGVLMGVI